VEFSDLGHRAILHMNSPLKTFCSLSSVFLPLFFFFKVREAGEQGDVEPRRIVRYPDSHQLFIGNLPHEVDKSELKDFFQSRSLNFKH
jgi:hypothetical protein